MNQTTLNELRQPSCWKRLLLTSISSPLPRNTAITNNNKIFPLPKVQTYTVSLKFIPHLPKQPFFKCFHIYVNVRIIRLSHQILPIRTSYYLCRPISTLSITLKYSQSNNGPFLSPMFIHFDSMQIYSSIPAKLTSKPPRVLE